MNLFLSLLFLIPSGPSGLQPAHSDSLTGFVNKTEKVLVYKTRTNTYYPAIMLRLGVVDFDFQSFNNAPLSLTGQTFRSVMPYAGLSYEFPIKLRSGTSFDNYVEFNYFIPQDLTQGGSYEATLKGYSASIACGRDLISQNKKSDIIVAMGLTGGLLHYGAINYITNYAGYTYNQTYFGPQMTVFPRFIFKQLIIGLRGSYRLDLLKRNWSGDTGASQLPPAVCTGWTAELVIGVQLGKY